MSIRDALNNFQSSWDEVELPIGKHKVTIENTKFIESKYGYSIMFTLSTTLNGREVTTRKYNPIDGKKLIYLKNDLNVLGVVIANITELEDIIESNLLIGKKTILEVYKKDGYNKTLKRFIDETESKFNEDIPSIDTSLYTTGDLL